MASFSSSSLRTVGSLLVRTSHPHPSVVPSLHSSLRPFSTFGNGNNNRNPPYPPSPMGRGPIPPSSSSSPGTGGRPSMMPPSSGRPGGMPPGTPPSPPPKPMGIIGAEEIKRKQAAEAKAANATSSSSSASSTTPTKSSSTAKPALSPDELIVDVDASNFAQVVLQSPVAVILDCWADWCQPCKQLTPRLEAVVKAAQGAVRLAKLNVDQQPAIAQQLQVRSLPTVFGIVGGRSVDAFQGVVPDDRLRAFMEKLISTAENAGMIPKTAGAPSNPIEEAEDMINTSHSQLDNGAYEEALRTIPELLTTLQAVEQKFLNDAAAKKQAETSSTPSSTTTAETSSVSSTSSSKRKVIAPNPVPQPIQDLTARALAALVRGYVANAQAAGSNVLKGQGSSSDSVALYDKAKGYATLLREKYRGSAALPEVQRALSAADLATGASSAITQLAPLLDEVKTKPNDVTVKLRLAEAQLGLGQNAEALETSFDILKILNGKTIGSSLSTEQITNHRNTTRNFIVKIFDTLGNNHPLVVQGRKQLSKLLFR